MAEKRRLKFTRTLADLIECYEDMDNKELGDAETLARRELISYCQSISDEYACELDD